MAKQGRAVVCGGGIGGLVSARVLSEHFAEVLIIERDVYPTEPLPRKRVPQGTQAHALLARGLQGLERFFPNLPARFDDLGVPECDFGLDVRQSVGDTLLPAVQASVPMRLCPRPALEAAIREEVRAIPGVRILEGTLVGEIAMNEASRVTGVHLSGDHGQAEALPCDLVVDCRGRGFDLAGWLEDMGFGLPRTEIVNAGFTYATVIFRTQVPKGDADPAAYFAALRFPDLPVGGLGMYQPDGTFMATLILAAGHAPPREIERFRAAFQGLPLPGLRGILEGAEAIGPVRLYKATMNRRHHVEALMRWPGGYLAIGDALCALNPRFGQGMTVATVEAEVLMAALKGGGRAALDRRPGAFTQALQRKIGAVLTTPWMMVCADDAAWVPERKASLVERISGWYLQRLVERTCESSDASIRFIRIAQMLDGPAYALHPKLLLPILAAALRPRPQALPQPQGT